VEAYPSLKRSETAGNENTLAYFINYSCKGFVLQAPGCVFTKLLTIKFTTEQPILKVVVDYRGRQ
jgi:hypothetical protein